jgi:hypothetical protein
MFLLATAPWGLAIHSDSLAYIGMAKYLSTGYASSSLFPRHFLIQILMHYLPFFPFCLSVMHRGGIDLLDGMRWFNAVLFGLNIFLAGLILIKHAKAFWPALWAAVIMSISPPVLTVSASAMSEPLYVFFMLLFLLLFFDYLQRPSWGLLVPAALAASLAAFTRYAGIPLIGAGMAGIFFCSHTSSVKIKHAFVFFLIGLFPMAVWFGVNAFCYGAVGGSPFIFHPPITPDYFYKSASAFCAWFLPANLPRAIKEGVLVVGILGLTAAGFRLFNKKPKAPDPASYSLLLITFIFFYTTGLIITVLFFDASVEPSQRIFLPVYVASVILCFGSMPLSLPSLKKDIVKIGLVYLLALYSVEAVPWLRHLYTEGSGYGNRHWKHSETLSRTMSFPSTVPVYTNVWAPVYIFRGGPVFNIPAMVVTPIDKANGRYLEDLAEMEKVLRRGNGLLVYFNDAPQNIFIEPVEKIGERLPLQLIAVYPDGRIYKIK